MRLITKPDKISRRAVLSGAASVAVSSFIPSIALALNEEIAVRMLRKVLADVDTIINSGKPLEQMLVDFEAIFRDYGEVPLIAKAVLGAPGRLATKSELSAYIRAFQGYLSRKYGRQFRDFAGAKMFVQGSRDAGSKGVLVQTIVDRPSDPMVEFEWWVIEINGKPKIFDLKIEGISMIASERTEIGALLESFQGDISKMTAHLNAN